MKQTKTKHRRGRLRILDCPRVFVRRRATRTYVYRCFEILNETRAFARRRVTRADGHESNAFVKPVNYVSGGRPQRIRTLDETKGFARRRRRGPTLTDVSEPSAKLMFSRVDGSRGPTFTDVSVTNAIWLFIFQYRNQNDIICLEAMTKANTNKNTNRNQ